MNSLGTVKPSELHNFLLQVALHYPVFIWGPPGIGKSSIVTQFAHEMGMECVPLIGQQLAPEDLIGVPKIEGDVSKFCPPSMLVKDKPYLLFLDEFNAASSEIQKAFMNLVLEKRIGEYTLPKGSIIVAAGNRQQDSALVKNLPSPLINRMIHIEMLPNSKDWVQWAYSNSIHEAVIEYIQNRPDHLFSNPPKTQETFSTPRSWTMLGKLLRNFNESDLTEEFLKVLVKGAITPSHAVQFLSFYKLYQNKFAITSLLKGDTKWPTSPSERDLLYFMVQSFRTYISKTLPTNKDELSSSQKELLYKIKSLISDCAAISNEAAQLILHKDESNPLPDWFLIEVARDLPHLLSKSDQ